MSQSFLDAMHSMLQSTESERTELEDPASSFYALQASDIVDHYGGTQSAIQQELARQPPRPRSRRLRLERGSRSRPRGSCERRSPDRNAGLLRASMVGGDAHLPGRGPGDGYPAAQESHVGMAVHTSGAARRNLMAEMLAPVAANPIYWSGPLFVGCAFGFIYGFPLGVLAVILIGVPVTLAFACMGKALEIAVILRFPPRSRGAITRPHELDGLRIPHAVLPCDLCAS